MKTTIVLVGIFMLHLINCSGQTGIGVQQRLALIHSNDLAFLNTNITDYGSNLAAAYAAYRHGKASKEMLMLLFQRAANAEPQDTYGKVVDQNGKPIAGAEIVGNVGVREGLGDGARNHTLTTQSDADGLFQFTGVKGWHFGIIVKKVGYAMSLRKGPSGTNTSPHNRDIFTMWKLQGAEQLVHFSFTARLPYDGTPVTFDCRNGRIVSTGGDLVIRLECPRNPNTSQQYDWEATIRPVGGGIVSDNSSMQLKFQAPDSGYRPEFKVENNKSTKPWLSTFHDGFYFNSRDGSLYGKCDLGIVIYAIKDGLVPITLEGYVNPAGSQNLEIDPKLVTEAHP